MTEPMELPNDLESCHRLIVELSSETKKLQKLLKQLMEGNRSEKRVHNDDRQGQLPFETEEELKEAQSEAEAEAEEIIKEYKRKRRNRKKKPRDESLPSHLPRVEKVIEVPDNEKHCVEHGERQVIGYDITETLKREPARLWVEVNKYPKYACVGKPECGVVSPERPTSLVEGNRYDTSVAAAIIEAKWGIYLPIYRQQDLFASSGWTPSRSTLLNLIRQSEFVLQPLVDEMTRLVQQDAVIGLDETSCRMLLPKEIPELIAGDSKSQRLVEKVMEARRKGDKSLLGKMWAYSGLHHAPYNIFDFRVSRHRDGPDEFLRNSHGIVVADCFSGNLSVVLASDERLRFAACWSHARRKVEAADTYTDQADTLLAMIDALYDINTRAKELTWEQRTAVRQRESTVVLAGIKKWLDSPLMQSVLPKSDFGEAIRYIRNHWIALNTFVSDGRVPMDNNFVERLMRQVALGRKAWLFVGNVEAGERSAKMMSLVSSAKRHDLDVGLYLKDVLDQMLAGSTNYTSLLPDQWKKQHPDAIRQYRVDEREDTAERKKYRAAKRRLARAKRRRESARE